MSKGFNAEATILIGRVVSLAAATNQYGVITAANATIVPAGISGQNSKFAQIQGYTANDTTHAENGDQCVVHRPGSIEANQTVYGFLGGTVTKGAPLMSAADGTGRLIAATAGKWAVAFADEGGVVDTMIPVTPAIFVYSTVS